MDCATISSDVIGDFQEPYRAVLVDGDDIAALPSNRLRLLVATGAAQPARSPLQVSALQADAFGRSWPGTPGFVSATDLRLLDILGWTPMPRNHAAAFHGAPAI